jgi:hypothetical protein
MKVVDLFRYYSGKFESKFNTWIISLKDFDNVVEKLIENGYVVEEKETFNEKKPKIRKIFIKKIQKLNIFEVDCKYSEDLIEIFKKISGRKFDSLTTRWQFPIAEYTFLSEKLMEMDNVEVVNTATLPETKKIGKYIPLN